MKFRQYYGHQLIRETYFFKVCGFHDGDHEEWRLLECYAVWLAFLQEPQSITSQKTAFITLHLH
jgi:hypothetical protein